MKSKGREALGIDDDSDEESLAKALEIKDGESKGNNEAKRKNTARQRRSFQTITIDGLALTVSRRKRYRGIVMPVDGPSLPSLLTYLKAKLQSSSEDTAGAPAAKRCRGESCGQADDGVAEAAPLHDDEDKGRVWWSFARHCWRLKYIDQEGKLRTTEKGFVVSRCDVFGQPLGCHAYASAREKMLAKARAAWNELDHSKTARYDVTAERGRVAGAALRSGELGESGGSCSEESQPLDEDF